MLYNKDNLIRIYNMPQAEFMIRYTKAEGLNRIGKAKKGDVIVSFFNIPIVRESMTEWKNRSH